MGAEHGVAAHGGAFEAGGEFFDVAAGLGDGGGELADDAGAVIADDVHDERAAGEGSGDFLTHGDDGEAGVAGRLEFADEGVHGVGGALDAGDACELTGEAGHAAFEPIAAMGGDGIGKRANETGAVVAEDCHDEVGLHGVNQAEPP